MGDKGTVLLERVNSGMGKLEKTNAYIEDAAEQRRIKLEENIKYMQCEKEARQVCVVPFVCSFLLC